jgi:thymidylate kinase
MIVAVEGIDCAGKGEVCPRLAKVLNAILYKTPPEHMRKEQDAINSTATDIEHYRYFTRVIQSASAEISELAKSTNVVIDRYWVTTVVYHRVMGVAARIEDMGDIVMPNFTIYLTVSPEVQIIRMNNRGMSPGDKRMNGRQHLLRQVYEEVLANQSGIIRIDTSNINPEQVIGLILQGTPSIRIG